MSWVSDAWDWYVANRETAAPLLAPLGSVLVGMGTIIVGGVVAWSALRQARTATNRHREQTRADQQRRVTESFSKAVEQLAHEKDAQTRLPDGVARPAHWPPEAP